MSNDVKQNDTSTTRKELARKRKMQVIIQLLIIAIILFVSSGRLLWFWAWLYIAIGVVIMIINSRVLPEELIAERAHPKEDVKKWDRIITSLNIIPVLGTLIVSGLDMRFGWTGQLNFGVNIVGIGLMISGNALFTWAMVSNKFFSTLVRIQTDRGHTVATDGPYRFIRHPGYAGYILFNLAMPLMLGSLWALIPAGMTTLLFIIRTALEDRTLMMELKGYREYADQVHHKLIPGIW